MLGCGANTNSRSLVGQGRSALPAVWPLPIIVHIIGRMPQCHLTKCYQNQILRNNFSRFANAACCGNVYFPLANRSNNIVTNIDQRHFIGSLHNGIRNSRAPGHHLISQTTSLKRFTRSANHQIGQDIDSSGYIVDILPTLSMTATRSIRVGKFIDQRQLEIFAGQCRRQN